MIVTIIGGKTKWWWLEKAYYDLKKNYSEVLYEQYIEVAVNYDAAFENTKKEYKKVRLLIGSIWIAAIIGMLVFTLVIGHHNQNNEPSPANTSDEQVTDESETEMPKTEWFQMQIDIVSVHPWILGKERKRNQFEWNSKYTMGDLS